MIGDPNPVVRNLLGVLELIETDSQQPAATRRGSGHFPIKRKEFSDRLDNAACRAKPRVGFEQQMLEGEVNLLERELLTWDRSGGAQFAFFYRSLRPRRVAPVIVELVPANAVAHFELLPPYLAT